jgi:hypothetical protein
MRGSAENGYSASLDTQRLSRSGDGGRDVGNTTFGAGLAEQGDSGSDVRGGFDAKMVVKLVGGALVET